MVCSGITVYPNICLVYIYFFYHSLEFSNYFLSFIGIRQLFFDILGIWQLFFSILGILKLFWGMIWQMTYDIWYVENGNYFWTYFEYGNCFELLILLFSPYSVAVRLANWTVPDFFLWNRVYAACWTPVHLGPE